MRHVQLSGEADVTGFREAARGLLAEGVPPAQVSWQASTGTADDLFASAPEDDATAAAGRTAAPVARINVPAFFVPLCERAALHTDPGRFALLYRLLWRLVHEPGLRGDPLDPDRVAAEALARVVRREMHKMTAFVRFRPIAGGAEISLGETAAEDDDAESESAIRALLEGADVDRPLATPATFSTPSTSPRTLVLATPAATAPATSEAPATSATSATSATAVTPATSATAAAPATSDTPATSETPETSEASATASTPAPSPTSGPPSPLDTGWHVAWFEPAHHIVEATAPFFARRFAQMRWAILTPERCVRWDGETLAFGPGARRDEAPPADAGERLWLTYYEHIFNPARLKLAAMKKEMPRRYWPNLPEAALIKPLSAKAAGQTDEMVERGGSEPARRLPRVTAALRVEAPAGEGVAPAAAPTTLAALRDATQRCRECPIGAQATQSVPGEGPGRARLVLVGEQPGDQEDLRGRPFVGPAGQLLDKALAQLGWPREALYLTNAVKHFKYELRGSRRIHKTPAQREVAACLHWLENEIDLIEPAAAVALGATAARALLGRAVGVTSERGRWLVRADGLPVLITLHPSALLRMEPSERAAAFERWLDDLRHAGPHARGTPPAAEE